MTSHYISKVKNPILTKAYTLFVAIKVKPILGAESKMATLVLQIDSSFGVQIATLYADSRSYIMQSSYGCNPNHQ